MSANALRLNGANFLRVARQPPRAEHRLPRHKTKVSPRKSDRPGDPEPAKADPLDALEEMAAEPPKPKAKPRAKGHSSKKPEEPGIPMDELPSGALQNLLKSIEKELAGTGIKPERKQELLDLQETLHNRLDELSGKKKEEPKPAPAAPTPKHQVPDPNDGDEDEDDEPPIKPKGPAPAAVKLPQHVTDATRGLRAAVPPKKAQKPRKEAPDPEELKEKARDTKDKSWGRFLQGRDPGDDADVNEDAKRTFPKAIGLTPRETIEHHELSQKAKAGTLSWFGEQRFKKLNSRRQIVHLSYDDLLPSEQKAVRKKFDEAYQVQVIKQQAVGKQKADAEAGRKAKIHEQAAAFANAAHAINAGKFPAEETDKLRTAMRAHPKLAEKVFAKAGLNISIPADASMPPSWGARTHQNHIKKGPQLTKLLGSLKRAEQGAKEGHYQSQVSLKHLRSILDNPENFSAKARAAIVASGITPAWNTPLKQAKSVPAPETKGPAKQGEPPKKPDEDTNPKEKHPDERPLGESEKDVTPPAEKDDDKGPTPRPQPKDDGNYKTPDEYRKHVGKCPPGYNWDGKGCKPDGKGQKWKPSSETKPSVAAADNQNRNLARGLDRLPEMSQPARAKTLDRVTSGLHALATAGHKAGSEAKARLKKTFGKVLDAVKPHLSFLRRQHGEAAGQLFNAVDQAHHVLVNDEPPDTWHPKAKRMDEEAFDHLHQSVSDDS